ncbi:MAG: tryptophan 2,3-dioxygenase family protein [Acidobacteriota bacterium]
MSDGKRGESETDEERPKPVTYWNYVKVEELLALQNGVAESEESLGNDEVLFITIHQIDELWFKLLLRELQATRDFFAQKYVPDTALGAAVRGFARMSEILRHAASHFSLMETMTTRDYMGFRDKLYPASGFQSAQLREIEILMGLSRDERIPLGHETYMQALRHPDGSESDAYRRVQARLDDPPSLNEALLAWLARTPIEGSEPDDDGDDEVVTEFVEKYLASQKREMESLAERAISFALTAEDEQRLADRYRRETQSARDHMTAQDVPEEERFLTMRTRAAILFIESYREHPLLAWPRAVVDAAVTLEQSFIVFRQRHARMVERLIGNRTGTGGSAGVQYLDRTALEYRVFKELWATRTLLLRKDALPEIDGAETYGFRYEPGK